ncbi:MAG: CRISPR-associated endoribonuclease Cas6 [Nitrososphaerota archaeon]|nr:CRISPR-associated endoribonuclease Cas6 [Aigarchaeota archaeon]MDW8077123.1 CRISPR-associated endoribonuclease Cas6 [Nitrososphaerota archaeon]
MKSKSIVRLSVNFTVTGRAIIPPFSAKVSKLILHRISELYRKYVDIKKPFKPISVSPLFHEGSPLIKLKGEDRMLMLSDDKTYSFNYCMITDEDFKFDELISLESSTINDVFGTSVILKSIKVEVKRYDSFGFMKPNGIKLTFLSPVLLQLPRFGRYGINRYMLFPLPSMLIGSLVEHWNNNCDSHMIIKNPFYLSYYSNYVLLEADFHLKPVTVMYDEKREIRGILGWVLYDLRKARNTPSLRRILALLDYAQYIGVGKSRATGFGQVSIKCM